MWVYECMCVCVLFELFSVYDSVCGYMSVICYVSVGILYEHMLYRFYECTCQSECGTLQGPEDTLGQGYPCQSELSSGMSYPERVPLLPMPQFSHLSWAAK